MLNGLCWGKVKINAGEKVKYSALENEAEYFLFVAFNN